MQEAPIIHHNAGDTVVTSPDCDHSNLMETAKRYNLHDPGQKMPQPWPYWTPGKDQIKLAMVEDSWNIHSIKNKQGDSLEAIHDTIISCFYLIRIYGYLSAKRPWLMYDLAIAIVLESRYMELFIKYSPVLL